jgi:hypothetical protein
MTTDVEDGIKVGNVDRRQLDRVLDELLSFRVVQEALAALVIAEFLHRDLPSSP